MILFLVTSAVLLGLLAGIPLWATGSFDQMPVAAVAILAVGVVLSAMLGRTPRD
jgi:hypothetical protein